MSQNARIVIFGIPVICLLVAMAIPNFTRSRVVTAKDSFINRLRQIDGAKVQWAFAHHKLTNDTPTWDDLRSYFIRTRLPLECPDGGVYTIGRVDELPSCSIARHTKYWRKIIHECGGPMEREVFIEPTGKSAPAWEIRFGTSQQHVPTVRQFGFSTMRIAASLSFSGLAPCPKEAAEQVGKEAANGKSESVQR
jgi:disulfide bond formation protein DsbB